MPGRAPYGASKAGDRRADAGPRRRVGRPRRARQRPPPGPGADADGRATRSSAASSTSSEVIDRTPAGQAAPSPRTSRGAVRAALQPRRRRSSPAQTLVGRRRVLGLRRRAPVPATAASAVTAPPIGDRCLSSSDSATSRARALAPGRDGSSRSPACGSSRSATGSSAACACSSSAPAPASRSTCVVDRAFDIGRCEHARPAARLDSRRVGFAGPWFYEPEGLGFFRSFGGGLLDHLRHRPRALHGRGHGRAVPLPAEADRDVRPARPRLEPAGPPRRLRRALGRRRVHPLGRGRDAAGGGLRRAAAAAPADRGAGRASRTSPSTTRSRTSATTRRRTCSSTTSTSASRSSTRARSCSSPRRVVEPRGDHPVEGYRTLAAPGGRLRRAGLRARARRASRTERVPVAVVNRRLGLGAYEVFRPRPAAAPLRLAHARRGHLRRRHRAVHEPHRRPARRPRARRADRARPRARAARYDLELGALVGEAELDAFAARVRSLAV